VQGLHEELPTCLIACGQKGFSLRRQQKNVTIFQTSKQVPLIFAVHTHDIDRVLEIPKVLETISGGAAVSRNLQPEKITCFQMDVSDIGMDLGGNMRVVHSQEYLISLNGHRADLLSRACSGVKILLISSMYARMQKIRTGRI
jgi:hypothetical protein